MSTRSGGIFDVDARREQSADLERQASFPEFWNDAERAREILRKKTSLDKVVSLWDGAVRQIDDAETLLQLADEAGDPSLAAEAAPLLDALEARVREMEVRRLLGEEADSASAVLEINAGAGGTDACDWADMLKRMY